MADVEVSFVAMVERGGSTTARALYEVEVDGEPLGTVRGGVASSLWKQTGVTPDNAEAVLRAYMPGRIRRIVEDGGWDDLQDFEDGKLLDPNVFNTDPEELRPIVEEVG